MCKLPLLLLCILVLAAFSISFRFFLLEMEKSYGCPRPSEATLKIMLKSNICQIGTRPSPTTILARLWPNCWVNYIITYHKYHTSIKQPMLEFAGRANLWFYLWLGICPDDTLYINGLMQDCSIPIDGLVQNCSISIANALEILQSCTKPSICITLGRSVLLQPKRLMYTPNALFMSSLVNVIVLAKQSGGQNIFRPAKY